MVREASEAAVALVPAKQRMPVGPVVLVLAAALPLVVAAAVTALRAPFLLLAVYAAVIPWGSSFRLPLGLPGPLETISTLVGLAATAGLALHLALGGRRARTIPRSVPAAILLLAVAVLTLPWSINPTITINDLMALAGLVGLYVVAALVRPARREMDVLEAGIAAGGTITGMVALQQLATGTIALTGAGLPRFETAGGGGEGGDPNVTAAVLILPLAVALARGVVRTGLVRVAYLAAGGVTALAIVLTGSRGGMFTALVVVVVVAGLGRPLATLLVALVPAVVAVITLASLAPDTLAARVGKTGSTGRTDIWRDGLRTCPRYCLQGAGWGTFARVYEESLLSTPGSMPFGRTTRAEAHNMWIGTVVEGGILAVVLLGAVFVFTVSDLQAVPRDVRAPPLAAVIGILIANMFLSTQDFKYFWLVLMYAALTTVAHRTEDPAENFPAPLATDRRAHA